MKRLLCAFLFFQQLLLANEFSIQDDRLFKITKNVNRDRFVSVCQVADRAIFSCKNDLGDPQWDVSLNNRIALSWEYYKKGKAKKEIILVLCQDSENKERYKLAMIDVQYGKLAWERSINEE